MPKLPGVNHMNAVRALSKLGYRVARSSKHIIMTKGKHTVVIPRNNPINGFTMGKIVKDAGLTVTEFRKLL